MWKGSRLSERYGILGGLSFIKGCIQYGSPILHFSACFLPLLPDVIFLRLVACTFIFILVYLTPIVSPWHPAHFWVSSFYFTRDGESSIITPTVSNEYSAIVAICAWWSWRGGRGLHFLGTGYCIACDLVNKVFRAATINRVAASKGGRCQGFA